MRVLLDTNALIWWLHDSVRLGPKAKQIIADPGVETLVSVVSLWEVTMKWRARKMDFSGSAMADDLASEGIEPLPVQAKHVIALDTLDFHHKDPFDHLLLAQAMVEGSAILTSDGEMTRYGVKCIPAMR